MKRGKLRMRLAHARDSVGDSFWLVPALQTLLACALAALTLWLDESLLPDLGDDVTWLFGGTAEGAWTLLQVIAGSLITVISVAFSVTLIAIQQASAQYSPRLLRNFTSDRANQVVLGTYVATFVYALLVLKEVRESTNDSDAFIPALSLFVAIVLALVSLAMLVYYIHHITESLQLPYLFGQIRRELDAEIERQFPEAFGRDSADPEQAADVLGRGEGGEGRQGLAVRCRGEGYLRRIDEGELQEAVGDLATEGASVWVEVPVLIGQYVRAGSVLVRIWSREELPAPLQDRLRNAFDFGGHRTVAQDPLFGIEQMVDVAVKALSPSINDPTTCTQALDQIAAALSLLQSREMPSPTRRLAQGIRCAFAVPTFADFVEASFGRIRRAASQEVSVQMHLLGLLEDLAASCPSRQRGTALRHQTSELMLQVEQQASLSEHDKSLLRQRTASVLQVLRELPARGS